MSTTPPSIFLSNPEDKSQDEDIDDISDNGKKNELYRYVDTFIKGISWCNTDDEANQYSPLYDKICNDIKYIPNIIDVLSLPINYDKKILLIEKIFILHNTQPITIEYFELKRYIINEISNCKMLKISETDFLHYEKIRNLLIATPSNMEYKILDMNINTDTKNYIYNKFKILNSTIDPTGKIRQWLEHLLNIPTKISYSEIALTDPLSVKRNYLLKIKNLMDKELYGLIDVKIRILSLINNIITNKEYKGVNFALAGPPGIAKTSIIQLVAKIINKPIFQINAAGIKDSSFLLGHNYTYESSGPGVIVQALQYMKTKNGILYIDEVDKISSTDLGSEVSRSLLHITDFTQNNKFHDRYIGENIDIDLSNLLFMYSMNDKTLIEPTLRDRISIIEIEGYTDSEKNIIAKKYLLPKAVENVGLNVDDITFDDSGSAYVVELSNYSSEIINGKSGVRQLNHIIVHIVTKINFLHTISSFKLPVKLEKKTLIELNTYEIDFDQ